MSTSTRTVDLDVTRQGHEAIIIALGAFAPPNPPAAFTDGQPSSASAAPIGSAEGAVEAVVSLAETSRGRMWEPWVAVGLVGVIGSLFLYAHQRLSRDEDEEPEAA